MGDVLISDADLPSRSAAAQSVPSGGSTVPSKRSIRVFVSNTTAARNERSDVLMHLDAILDEGAGPATARRELESRYLSDGGAT